MKLTIMSVALSLMPFVAQGNDLPIKWQVIGDTPNNGNLVADVNSFNFKGESVGGIFKMTSDGYTLLGMIQGPECLHDPSKGKLQMIGLSDGNQQNVQWERGGPHPFDLIGEALCDFVRKKLGDPDPKDLR